MGLSSNFDAHAPVIHANNVNNKNIRAEAKRAIFIYKVFELQSYKKNLKNVPLNALYACFSKILYIILYVKFDVMQVTTISGFRANIKQYYDNVLLTEEPLIITKGDTGAVLISLREYNSMQRSLELLKNSSAMRDLREAALQMKAGELIEVTDIDAL